MDYVENSLVNLRSRFLEHDFFSWIINSLTIVSQVLKLDIRYVCYDITTAVVPLIYLDR